MTLQRKVDNRIESRLREKKEERKELEELLIKSEALNSKYKAQIILLQDAVGSNNRMSIEVSKFKEKD